ncbi:MAG TPA: LapA family protein [Miltoncostaeaceae bacterium]|nr:LapA family protein [Miltoncostaeaceae bacterium]
MSTSNPSSHPANATKERGLRTHLALIGAAVGVVLVVIWMIRNSRSVRVDWLFGSTNAPLWLVIIIAAVLGWLVGTATTALVRRRRGAHE